MQVSTWVWFATLGGLLAILLADLFVIGRRPHEPTTRESALWVSLYVAMAIVFGLACCSSAVRATAASSSRVG